MSRHVSNAKVRVLWHDRMYRPLIFACHSVMRPDMQIHLRWCGRVIEPALWHYSCDPSSKTSRSGQNYNISGKSEGGVHICKLAYGDLISSLPGRTHKASLYSKYKMSNLTKDLLLVVPRCSNILLLQYMDRSFVNGITESWGSIVSDKQKKSEKLHGNRLTLTGIGNWSEWVNGTKIWPHHSPSQGVYCHAPW